MSAPPPAPSAVPPRVPVSRVESGCPEHPATTNAPANAILAITPDFLRIKRISFITPITIRNLGLFGFLLPLQLLNLLPLLFDFLLLLLHLRLSLLIRGFLILHRVANREPCTWSADGGADNRPGRSTNARTSNRALLPRGERRPGASGDQKQRRD